MPKSFLVRFVTKHVFLFSQTPFTWIYVKKVHAYLYYNGWKHNAKIIGVWIPQSEKDRHRKKKKWESERSVMVVKTIRNIIKKDFEINELGNFQFYFNGYITAIISI